MAQPGSTAVDDPPADEELAEGTATNDSGASWLALLNEPLDQRRVKGRAGRGGGNFSYLETWDVKATLNRIFGYDGWGYDIVEQVEIGAVEVARNQGQPNEQTGWHVGYRCRVRLHVDGFHPSEGSGYGDGVEYGPAARITACELAIKESESDGFKRAATKLGQQFGLLLYAKTDQDAARARDENADVAERVNRDVPAVITLPEGLSRLGSYVEDGRPWLKAAVAAFYGVKDFTSMNDLGKKLDQSKRLDLLKRLQQTVSNLDSLEAFDGMKPEEKQAAVVAAFAHAFDGLTLEVEYRPPIPF